MAVLLALPTNTAMELLLAPHVALSVMDVLAQLLPANSVQLIINPQEPIALHVLWDSSVLLVI